MSDKWIHKNVIKVRRWTCQYWHCADTNMDRFTEQQQLDQAIISSKQSFKHDQTTSVVGLETAQEKFVLKRYNPRTTGHKVKRAFRRSRARRCWDMSYAFASAGLNVAPPLLMFEARIGPIRGDAYFMNRHIQADELLVSLPAMQVTEKHKVAKAISRAFAQMRAHKLSHGDMKASNLLWADGTLFFIDLDAATRHRTRWFWRRAHRKDKRRFLKNWEQYPELLSLFSEL